MTHRFRGSGGFKALVLFVSHDKQCIIADKDAITFGYVTFDHKSEMGKYALDGLKRQAAELWNRRAE